MIPIVLHHGFMGFPNLQAGPFRLKYFRKIDHVLASRGHPVIVTRVHPTAGIERRARQLKDTILSQLQFLHQPDERIVIIAHSLGGLDARYMISKLGMEEHVAALLTVSTPHRGSPYADWCLRYIGQRLGAMRLARMLGLDIQAVVDLTTESCKRFNDEVPDSPHVRYFSVSAARPWFRVPPFAMHSHRVVREAEGDNDGLVSVQSSQWANHLGVWPADHWHTINHRMTWEFRHATGDICPYYLNALDKMGVANVAVA